MNVEEGSVVKKGQIVARLYADEYRAALGRWMEWLLPYLQARLARALGSAFSLITRLAEVCWQKTTHSPLVTPDSRTQAATSRVRSVRPRPRVCTAIRFWYCISAV